MTTYSFFIKNFINTPISVLDSQDLSSVEYISGMINRIGTPLHFDTFWKATKQTDLVSFLPSAILLDDDKVQFYGPIKLQSTLVPNQTYYLAKNGGITRTNDTDIIIGFSTATDELFVDIQLVNEKYPSSLKTIDSVLGNSSKGPGIAGYTYDCFQLALTTSKNINKILFNTDSIIASSRTDVVYNTRNATGFYSKSSGYSKAGYVSSNAVPTYIDKLWFINDTIVTSTNAAPALFASTAISISAYAYVRGGNSVTPGLMDSVSSGLLYRYQFVNDNLINITNTIGSERFAQSGFQSEQVGNGYFFGGVKRVSTTNTVTNTRNSWIEKFIFINQTLLLNTLSVIDVTNRSGYNSNGVSSATHGYCIAPIYTPETSLSSSSKFNFLTEAQTSLSQFINISRASQTNVQSNTGAYVCGGSLLGSYYNVVEKFLFETDTNHILTTTIRCTSGNYLFNSSTFSNL